jgi:hypothetical protein
MSLGLEGGKRYYDDKAGIFVTPRQHSEYRRRFSPKKESFPYTTGNTIWDMMITMGVLFTIMACMILIWFIILFFQTDYWKGTGR